jgi:hypothetical protein
VRGADVRPSEGDGENSTWLLGAPDVLLPTGDPTLTEIDHLNEQGLRVLLAAGAFLFFRRRSTVEDRE